MLLGLSDLHKTRPPEGARHHHMPLSCLLPIVLCLVVQCDEEVQVVPWKGLRLIGKGLQRRLHSSANLPEHSCSLLTAAVAILESRAGEKLDAQMQCEHHRNVLLLLLRMPASLKTISLPCPSLVCFLFSVPRSSRRPSAAFAPVPWSCPQFTFCVATPSTSTALRATRRVGRSVPPACQRTAKSWT